MSWAPSQDATPREPKQNFFDFKDIEGTYLAIFSISYYCKLYTFRPPSNFMIIRSQDCFNFTWPNSPTIWWVLGLLGWAAVPFVWGEFLPVCFKAVPGPSNCPRKWNAGVRLAEFGWISWCFAICQSSQTACTSMIESTGIEEWIATWETCVPVRVLFDFVFFFWTSVRSASFC